MKRDALIILGLVAITLMAFGGVGECGFVNYDDFRVIVDNPHLIGGLTTANFAWAWKTFDGGPHELGLYIPLTSLSLMLNATLFGPGPHGFHWVNVAIHIANSIFVYLFFRHATGAVWRSALVAAIFAVHPLRVESVAWVAERKDVLSTFFGLLTMLAYLRFVRRPNWQRYAAILPLFIAGLLCKPAVITLPFLLLLLDYWPLGRWVPSTSSIGSGQAGSREQWEPDPARPHGRPQRTVLQLILEKLPLLAIAGVLSLVAMSGIATDRTAVSVKMVPLPQRLANVPVSYVRYLGKMIWFGHLAPLYPRQSWSAAQVAGSCLLLLIVTAICLWNLRSRPWLAVGWCWFLGVLVPMLGVVQVGSHAMADRYTYVSGIGLLLMAVWSIPPTAWRTPVLVVGTAGTGLGLLVLFTIAQTRYWRNNITLFRRDIAVVGSNRYAELILGKSLRDRGDLPEAVDHLEKSLNFDPNRADAQGDLALALALWKDHLKSLPNGRDAQGDLALVPALKQCDRALPLALAAVAQEPDKPDWHIVLGYIHLQNKQYDDALLQARKAIDLNPRAAYGHRLLGWVLYEMGDTRQGIEELKLALSIKPDLKDGQRDLQRFQNSAMHQ